MALLQLPNTHLRGSGCPKCLAASKRSKGEIDFVNILNQFYPARFKKTQEILLEKKNLMFIFLN